MQILFLFVLQIENSNEMVCGMTSTKPIKQKVKILGQVVTVGTKKHAALLVQVKHFNDLAKYENN